MGVLKCLICCRPNEPKKKKKEAKDKEKLSDQIRVIFILRNLLKVPESVCQTYLLGKGNPCEWISTCPRCSLIVEEALFIHRQINQLQRKLETLEVKVRNEIRQSFRPHPRVSKTKAETELLQVTLETQDFIAQQGIEDDDEEEDELEFHLQEFVYEEVAVDIPLNSDKVQDQDPLQITITEDPARAVELGGSVPSVLVWLDPDGSIKEEMELEGADDDYRVSEGDVGSSESEDEVILPKITQVNSRESVGTRTRSLKSSQATQETTQQSKSANTVSYECDICSRQYTNATSLRAHRKNIHNIYAEQERKAQVQNSSGIVNSQTKNVPTHSDEANNAEERISNPSTSKPIRKVYRQKIRFRKHRRHCEVCNEVFPTLKELFSHRKDVHNLIPLGEKPPHSDQCEFCGRKFTLYSSLRRHRLGVHGVRERVYIPMKKNDDRPWKCSECTESFALDKDRDEHEKTVHNKEISDLPFGCLICNKQFRIKTELVLHYDEKHKPVKGKEKEVDAVTFHCDKCPSSRPVLRFPTEELLEKHIQRVHLGDLNPYKCSVCGKGCRHPGHLRKHMQIHTGNRDFMCEMCGKTFTCSTLVAYHKLREHAEEDKPNPLRCDQCQKIFSTKTYLRLHKATVHEKKFRHFCEVCGMGFQSPSNLKVHLLTHNKTKKFRTYCTKKRRERERLEREKREMENTLPMNSQSSSFVPAEPHENINSAPAEEESSELRKKSPSEIFRCLQCPKERRRKYTDEKVLQRHVMRCHEGDKTPYKCTNCGKGCHSQGALRLHMQVHTGERLFPCDICSEKFTSATYVTYHKNRKHPEQGTSNPLECELCSKTFASKSNLRMHIASIHEKKFKCFCETCGMGFQNPWGLKKHKKKHNITNQKRKAYTKTKDRTNGAHPEPDASAPSGPQLPVPGTSSSSMMESGESNPITYVPQPHPQGYQHNPSEFDILQSCIDFSTQF